MLTDRAARRALVASLRHALSACVTLPPNSPRSPQDPWESLEPRRLQIQRRPRPGRSPNRSRAPTCAWCRSPIRTGVSNFFANLNTPTVMINDALQGKFRAAANDLGRFLLNTTVGIGGLLDPATAGRLGPQRRGFRPDARPLGRARRSVPRTAAARPFGSARRSGAGSSTPTPIRVSTSSNTDVKYGLWGLYLVDRRASLLPLDETLKNVYDPYAFIRDAYLRAARLPGVRRQGRRTSRWSIRSGRHPGDRMRRTHGRRQRPRPPARPAPPTGRPAPPPIARDGDRSRGPARQPRPSDSARRWRCDSADSDQLFDLAQPRELLQLRAAMFS